jgi:hypothetical protein
MTAPFDLYDSKGDIRELCPRAAVHFCTLSKIVFWDLTGSPEGIGETLGRHEMKTHASRLSQNGLLLRREFINIYERGHFLSMASAAENFLSTCGPERRAPECSTQRSPAETPQVGQGTADICSGVSSFFFIPTQCENIGRETVQFCTLLVSAASYWGPLRFPYGARFNSVVQDNTQEGIVYVDRAFVLDKA